MDRKKKFRQYRSNQGRPPRQQQSNEKLAFLAIIALFVLMLYLILDSV